MPPTHSDPDSSVIPEPGTLVIGLTGGIGSGKSTVANGFLALGVPVIDTDELARDLVEPGQPALAEIAAAFGPEVLTPAGNLDRAAVRQLIYADPARKSQLEAILHPKIRTLVRALLAASEAPYSVVVIPLLLETGFTDLVDRILVVDVPENKQLARVTARDGLPEDEILAIMQTQADRTTRLAAADDIIANDQDICSLNGHIEKLHRHYMEISNEQ